MRPFFLRLWVLPSGLGPQAMHRHPPVIPRSIPMIRPPKAPMSERIEKTSPTAPKT